VALSHPICSLKLFLIRFCLPLLLLAGKGGKNRRRGKGDGEESKRELEFKEDGTSMDGHLQDHVFVPRLTSAHSLTAVLYSTLL
jgi:hypothetical protein